MSDARAGPSLIDAVVVGAGPNGLAAAIALARAGRSVEVLEAAASVGGGASSAELTLPGFVHDVCSAVHPMARASPFFQQLDLERLGLRWIEPEVQLAHPMDDGETVLVVRDLAATARSLGPDERAYLGLVGFVSGHLEMLLSEFAGPFRVPFQPARAIAAARFGLRAIQPVTWLARRFESPGARALLGGCAAHSMLRLTEPLSGATGLLLLASAHSVGWPFAAGGTQRVADALAACLLELGGTIETGRRIARLEELRPHRAALLDLGPRAVLALAGERLARRRLGALYVAQLRRYRYGPGVFKMDFALNGPIPWRDPRIARSGTVHLGGTLEEIAAAEDIVRRGGVPERPFVLLAQPSVADPSRAPAGRHTAWAYCHVPNGSAVDMRQRIMGQIERFAPGFRDLILAATHRGPAELERANPNNVGGDILGGLPDLRQFFTRPVVAIDPYRTADPRVLICSSSTPPGAGVHGLCGWHAARSALRGVLRDVG